MTCRLLPVALSAVLIGTSAAVAGLPPAGPRDLTSAVAARIDRIAEEYPPEKLSARKVDFHGNIAAWMIARTPLTPAEEVASAGAAREQMIGAHRTSPLPGETARVLERLLRELPPHLQPEPIRYSLTVLDVPQFNAFAIGGGNLFITTPFLQAFLDDGERGRDMLAFVLAHEIGHTALQHCRRGYQLIALEEELSRQIELRVDRALLAKILETSLAPAGALTKFLYSREQEYDADLFALHLCRNAGISAERVLDGARYLCLLTYPQLLTDPAFVPHPLADRSTLIHYLSSHPNPFRRVSRLHRELSGEPDAGCAAGLFTMDLTTEELSPCPNRMIPEWGRAIVFIHGMEGTGRTYAPLMQHLAAEEAAHGVPLIVFQYPNDQSLARSGELLRREMSRICADCREVDFVCHSAGGLVFRYYAEVRGGAFRRAVFHGTPHGGSDLARLRSLLEASQFVRDLKLGYPESLQQTLLDGNGQITHDLHPDSLFLRYLDRHKTPFERYYIFRGRVLRKSQAIALEAAATVSRELLRSRIEREIESEFLRRLADHYADYLKVPPEIGSGDLAVSFDSAWLQGAAEVHDSRHNHVTIKMRPDVLRETARIVLEVVPGE
jgi:Zn-dependent protease with chaperone function/pimeloyl-ACP methyl ester carboxylesterase